MTENNVFLKSSILEAVRNDEEFRDELIQALFPNGLTVSIEDTTDVFESGFVSIRSEVDLGYSNLRCSATVSFNV